MKDFDHQEVTALLKAWKLGEVEALPQLVPLVYRELQRLAHSYMAGERLGHTLETTALVNEAFLRLMRLHDIEWQDRNHFYAISARLMRRILIEFARSRRTSKRGGDFERVSLTEHLRGGTQINVELIDLDQALERLSGIDERKARAVELRFFGGLTVDQTAEVLGVSKATVMRDWEFSKAWILHELKEE